ncbi:MAG: RnfABCDGE type electron transport complex subunit B [Desulfobacula sp.]|uniref:RnfABCDGE type electron transport complex subunit B n=1 Tax=Desulfobacula sp. TaxID=2593537 RepID=UPI0025BC306E|nr:RnfABCDGE type electron transport complex subunit B [Desulfobacula sp.]MCD4721980.1 RnfABCDGE type electron transport complex subunit B [Desulfobacula sp.]
MIIKAILVMSAMGFVMALILALASKIFYVKEDPRLEKLKAVLPGTNCGGCGFAGCQGAADALIKKKASVNVCIVGGAKVAEEVAKVLGQSMEFTEPLTIQIGCTGGNRAETRYYYQGLNDCRAEQFLFGGSNVCENGCLGHGSCVSACPFDAIFMGPDHYPIVNPDLCKSCGKCVKICPRGVISISSQSDRLLKLNLKEECLAPCRQKCPAQINIPLFISQMVKNDYKAALLTIKERNPLVLTVSRLCAHPCENICRRNIADEGVAVGRLERFLGEWEMNSNQHVPIICAPDTGHRVALVGGGPAGLSCAYFLRRLGHHPVIFEKRSNLGGMLRYGIPEYRLPRHVVDWEIEGILNLGVEVETNVTLGKDFTLSDLKNKGFESIFLGLGAWSTPLLCIEGENVENVISSLDFLAEAGVTIKTLAKQKVVVVGESNTAMDCARICIRMGALSVTVICPKDQKKMSARKSDVERAMEEGVKIMFLTIPFRVRSDNYGGVTHIEYMQLIPLEGKKKSEIYSKVPDSEDMIEAQWIIAAYERKPDLYYICHEANHNYNFKASDKWTLVADKDTLLAGESNVFTAGDMYTGRATVISAVADGRRAARSIHFMLSTGAIPIPENLHRKINTKSILKKVKVSQQIPKVVVSEIPAEIRRCSLTQDIVGTITEEQVQTEAERCLCCGTTCYNQ